MDDLPFGNSNLKTPLQEAWHNAQKRKQYNIIRVKYPTSATVNSIVYELPNDDFYVEYDTNQHQRISYNTTIDIPYYIAIRYVEGMKDKIVNFVTQKMHDEYIADRDKKGLPRYTDKSTENKETYETQAYPKTNDEKIIAELYDQLWLGLVHVFGMDTPPQRENSRSGEVDLTPVSMRTIESMSQKKVEATTQSPFQQVQGVPFTPPIMTPTQSIPPKPSGFSQMNEALSASEVTKNE